MTLYRHGGSRHLSRDDLLLHLLGEGVLEGEVVPPVDQQLVLQVLRGVEVLASRLLAVAPALNTIVAGGHPPVLHLDVGRRVCELALGIAPCALLPLELAAHLQLQPAGVLLVEQRGHVEHGEHLRVHVGGVGHRRVCGHRDAGLPLVDLNPFFASILLSFLLLVSYSSLPSTG